VHYYVYHVKALHAGCNMTIQVTTTRLLTDSLLNPSKCPASVRHSENSRTNDVLARWEHRWSNEDLIHNFWASYPISTQRDP